MKKTISMNGLEGSRELPDLFSVEPLSASRLAPAGKVSNLDVLMPFFERESLRVAKGMAQVPPGGLWRGGFICSGYGELQNPHVGRFSPIDGISPAFLDLNSWGKFVERDGILFYIPTPQEMVDLLDGKEITPSSRRPWAGVNRKFYLGAPSLGSYSPAEVAVFYGSSLTLMLGRTLELNPEFRVNNKGVRSLDLGEADATLPRGSTVRARLARAAQMEVESYQRIDCFADVVHSDDNRRISISSMRGLENSFDRETWRQILAGLVEADKLRRDLEKEESLAREDSAIIGTPGGFMLGRLSFGFCACSASAEAVARDLAATREALASLFKPVPEDAVEVPHELSDNTPFVADYSLPLEQWDPRAFVFFLRCLDEAVLQPVIGDIATRPGFQHVRGILSSAAEGTCYSAAIFLKRFPGGREGFHAWLDSIFEAAAKVVVCDRGLVQKSLPRELCYVFPSDVGREDGAYLNHSLEQAHAGGRVLQSVRDKTLRVIFPSFSSAWRQLSGEMPWWPAFPGENGEDVTMMALKEYCNKLPSGDRLLDAMKDAFEHLPDAMLGHTVTPDFLEVMDAYVSRVSWDFEGGLYRRPKVHEVMGLLKGGVLPSSELPRLRAKLDADRGTDGDRFAAVFKKALPDMEKSPGLLEFQNYSPLGPSAREKVVFTRAKAERELYGWYAKDALLRPSGKDIAAEIPKLGPLGDMVERVQAICMDIAAHYQRGTANAVMPDFKPDVMLVCEHMKSLKQMVAKGTFDSNMSSCTLKLLQLLQHAPLGSMPFASLPEGTERRFMERLASIEDHNCFLELLHDHEVVPYDFSFQHDWDAVDKVLAERRACRETLKWRFEFCQKLQDLSGPAFALQQAVPFLSKLVPGFGAMHPVSMISLNYALIEKTAWPEGILKTVISSLRQVAGELDLRPRVAEGVLIHRNVTKMAATLVAGGPVFGGLAVSSDQYGFHLHGLGALYYSCLASSMPGVREAVRFDAHVFGLPNGFGPELLPVLNLEKANSAACAAYSAHYLFRAPQSSPTIPVVRDADDAHRGGLQFDSSVPDGGESLDTEYEGPAV